MTTKCGGIHCPGCGDGGSGALSVGGLIVAGLIGLALYHVATSHAVEHAASQALMIAVYTVLSIVSVTVVGTAVTVGLYVRRRLALPKPVAEPTTVRATVIDGEPVRLVSVRPVAGELDARAGSWPNADLSGSLPMNGRHER